MNTSHVLLLCIILIISLIIFNKIYLILSINNFKNEHINNDLPDNQVTQEGDSRLLIPTSEQTYNLYDTNRPDNTYSHQTTELNNMNDSTGLANTDPSIPIVYSFDELSETTDIIPLNPSSSSKTFDTGSGQINGPDEINNNIMNNFDSIE